MRKALKHCWLRPRPVITVPRRRILTTSYARGPLEVWAMNVPFQDVDVDVDVLAAVTRSNCRGTLCIHRFEAR